MKVFIVGGYGGFGERLARLLLGDGAQVSVAGRDLSQARAFTCRYGGEACSWTSTAFGANAPAGANQSAQTWAPPAAARPDL